MSVFNRYFWTGFVVGIFVTLGVLFTAFLVFFMTAEPVVQGGPATGTARGAGLPVPNVPTDFDQLDIIGQADRAWTLIGLDGASVTFNDLEGRVVVLNFWATWCAPCLFEMPNLEALRESVDEDAVAFVFVTQESPDVVRPFVESRGWDLPIYFSPTFPPALFRASGIPATFIVDAEGAIVFRHVGAADWNHPNVRDFIRTLTASAHITALVESVSDNPLR